MTSNDKEREAVVLRVIEENGQDYAVIHVDELARLQARAALQPVKEDSNWTLHDAAQMLLRRILLHGYDDSPNAEAEWERDFLVSQGVVWGSVLAKFQPMKRRDDLAQPDKAGVAERAAQKAAEVYEMKRARWTGGVDHYPDNEVAYVEMMKAALSALPPQRDDGGLTIADYEAAFADHRRLVRELDVALNGEEGAAQQASLCDIVGQVKQQGITAQRDDGGVVDEDARVAATKAAFEHYYDHEEFTGETVLRAIKAYLKHLAKATPPSKQGGGE